MEWDSLASQHTPKGESTDDRRHALAATGGPDVVVLVPTLHPKGAAAELIKHIPGISEYEDRVLYYIFGLASSFSNRLVVVMSRPPSAAALDVRVALTAKKLVSTFPDRISESEAEANVRSRLVVVVASGPSGHPLIDTIRSSLQVRESIVAAIEDSSIASSYDLALQDFSDEGEGVPPTLAETPKFAFINPTGVEAEVAASVGARMVGAGGKHLWMGTKGGSRRLFGDARVPAAPGTSLQKDVTQLAMETLSLWRRLVAERGTNAPAHGVLKLNEGFSGKGNAVVNMRPVVRLIMMTSGSQDRSIRVSVPASSGPTHGGDDLGLRLVLDAFEFASFADGVTWGEYSKHLQEAGALVEAMIEPRSQFGTVRTPSVQLYIRANGDVQVMGSHEQIMDSTGQIFQGSQFPADEGYRARICKYGCQTAEAIAHHGGSGWLSVDFLAVCHAPGEPFEVYALEVNLRPGGTTHTLMALRLLGPGALDPETLAIRMPDGSTRSYVASDNLHHESFKHLRDSHIIEEFCVSSGPSFVDHFNLDTCTGVLFHMLGCLPLASKCGAVFVAPSIEEAVALQNRVKERMVDMAKSVIEASSAVRPPTSVPAVPIAGLRRPRARL